MNLLRSKKIIAFNLLLTFFAFGCNNEDVSNNITVKVNSVAENEQTVADQSGVQIELTRGSAIFTGVTDHTGRYIFKNLPYGIFNVKLSKPGFISDLIAPELSNQTTDSTLERNYRMLKIPQFKLEIDSIAMPPAGETYRMYAFGRITNLLEPKTFQYAARVFFSDKPDVTYENNVFWHYGYVLRTAIENDKCRIGITNWHHSWLIPAGYDSLFVRIYPCVSYFEWTTRRDEALGTPSDVFLWHIKN